MRLCFTLNLFLDDTFEPEKHKRVVVLVGMTVPTNVMFDVGWIENVPLTVNVALTVFVKSGRCISRWLPSDITVPLTAGKIYSDRDAIAS